MSNSNLHYDAYFGSNSLIAMRMTLDMQSLWNIQVLAIETRPWVYCRRGGRTLVVMSCHLVLLGPPVVDKPFRNDLKNSITIEGFLPLVEAAYEPMILNLSVLTKLIKVSRPFKSLKMLASWPYRGHKCDYNYHERILDLGIPLLFDIILSWTPCHEICIRLFIHGFRPYGQF